MLLSTQPEEGWTLVHASGTSTAEVFATSNMDAGKRTCLEEPSIIFFLKTNCLDFKLALE